MKSYAELAMEQVSNALAQNIEYATMIELTGLYPYRDVLFDYLYTTMDYRKRDKKKYNSSKVKALRKVLRPTYTKKLENLVDEARSYGDTYLSGDYDPEEYGIIKYNTWNKFMHNNEKSYSEIYDFLAKVDYKENRKTGFEVYCKNDRIKTD